MHKDKRLDLITICVDAKNKKTVICVDAKNKQKNGTLLYISHWKLH